MYRNSKTSFMADFEYDQNKPCTTGRLKLFGFNVDTEDYNNQEEVAESMKTSSDPGGFTPSDGRKYECQYCYREFANSQALGGHQNAHKKERQQLKRAQIQATRNAAVSFMRNPMVSAFSPPAHLFPSSAAASPSWVYVPHSAQQFHVFPSGRGVGSLSYGNSAGESSSLTNVGPMQTTVKAHSGRLDVPSLSRFSGSEDGPCYDDGFGLDLHLSLAPSSAP